MAIKTVTALYHSSWLYHPELPEHWERCSLYSMARWANGLAFRDTQFTLSGMPIIKIAEIKGGISSQTKFTEQTFDDSVRVKYGDLLFSWSGQPETSIGAFWWTGPEGWLNQHIFRVTPASGIDPSFLYYLLRYLQPQFVGIARNKQTTGLGHVTKKDLENIEVGYPQLNEQRVIAYILGTLDDKTEVNRQMNQTLEQIAQALFKSWFIDFDPVIYNAINAENPMPERFQPTAERYRQDPEALPLPQRLLDLFPDRFEDSELGESPVGWETKAIGDVLDLAYGRSLPQKARVAGSIPVYGSGGITGWHNISLVEGPGIVIGRKGTVGSVYWAEAGFYPIDTVFYVKTRESLPLYWLFLKLSRMNIRSLGADSAVPGVNRKAILAQKWIMPDRCVMNEFQSICNNYLDQIYANEGQIVILSDIQNILLPKLISGELSIAEAEKVVEGIDE